MPFTPLTAGAIAVGLGGVYHTKKGECRRLEDARWWGGKRGPEYANEVRRISSITTTNSMRIVRCREGMTKVDVLEKEQVYYLSVGEEGVMGGCIQGEQEQGAAATRW